MKNSLLNAIKSYRIVIFLVFILISVILTAYSFYKQIPNVDIKQEIRTLLESINPEILSKIDKGRAKILVPISPTKLVKLTNLSENPNFNKYLSVEQFTRKDDFNDFKDPNILVDVNDFDWFWNNTYYLCPKDALIK